MIWTEIDNHISQVTGEKFVSQQHLSISGGCINQGFAISDRQLTYFVKLNQASRVSMFAAEMLGLKQMSTTGTIRVPGPICWGTTGKVQYQ
jgi:fructosamine-3-kinase